MQAVIDRPSTDTLTKEEFVGWVQGHIDTGLEPLDATAEVVAELRIIDRLPELLPLIGGWEGLAHTIWRLAQHRIRALDMEEVEGTTTPIPFQQRVAGEPMPTVHDATLLQRPTATTPLDKPYWTGKKWLRLGDMTKADCLASANFYNGQARGNARKQRWFAILAERLNDKETVEQHFDAKTVSDLLKTV